MQEDKFLKNYL